jgi:hypothetical protein
MGTGAGKWISKGALLHHEVGVTERCYGDFDEKVVGTEILRHWDLTKFVGFVVLASVSRKILRPQ